MEKRTLRNTGILNAAWRRWLVAALFAAVCVLLTHLVYHATFLNNDDTNIMYALAGYRSGAPYPAHRFINVLLGLLISGLYRLLPAVPWWAAYQIAMLLLSLTVINACLLKLCVHNGVPFLPSCLLLAALYAGVFVYTVVWTTFTLTAAMLGTAGVALLLSQDEAHDTRAERVASAMGAIALLTACFLTRNSSGYCMLCFYGAAMLYRWLSACGQPRGRLAAGAAVGLALVAVVVVINSIGISYYNPVGYRDFETARGHFIDYPHAAYADDPAFYEAMGWDETVYALADNLCFIDPVVNAETMEAASMRQTDVEKSLVTRVRDTLDYGIAFFRGSGASEYMLVIVALLFLFTLLCYGRGAGGRTELVMACLVAAGAFLLCFYLCYAGRFPVRTFMLIAIPTALTEAVFMVRVYGENGRRFFRPDTWRAMFASNTFHRRRRIYALCAAVACVCLAWSLVKTQIALFSYDKTRLTGESAAVEEYVIAHPENIYLTDVTSVENIALFTVYPDENARPVNLIDWGGTGMCSGWKTAQLAVNGLAALTPDIFLRDNVYFITATDNDKLPLLDAYLREHADGAGYVATDTITGTLNVYRFYFDGEAQP